MKRIALAVSVILFAAGCASPYEATAEPDGPIAGPTTQQNATATLVESSASTQPPTLADAALAFAGEGEAKLVHEFWWHGNGSLGLQTLRDAEAGVHCSWVQTFTFVMEGSTGGYLQTRDQSIGFTTFGAAGPSNVGPVGVPVEYERETWVRTASGEGESWGPTVMYVAAENLQLWDGSQTNATYHIRSECEEPHRITHVAGSTDAVVLHGADLEQVAAVVSAAGAPRALASWSGSLAGSGTFLAATLGEATHLTVEHGGGTATWNQVEDGNSATFFDVAAGPVAMEIQATDDFRAAAFFVVESLAGPY